MQAVRQVSGRDAETFVTEQAMQRRIIEDHQIFYLKRVLKLRIPFSAL